MKLQKPTSFTAGRKLVIGGTTFQPGATVSVAVAKTVKHLSSLTNRRHLIPNLDPHYRKNKPKTPTPTDLSGAQRRAL